MKKKVAIVRGKFLNKYEMQFFEPLVNKYQLLGIGSKTCFHNKFAFPVIKLPSPADLPNFPYKMQFLNRILIDANYLFSLEKNITGFDIAHPAESYYHFTIQCLNAKKKGLIKKIVVSIYENIPFAGEGIWGRVGFKKRVYKEADHIIAVSNKTKSALVAEGCDEDKISIITQHIDTNNFYPNRNKNKGKNIKILFSGRLEKYKGVYDFVKVADILLSDNSLKDFSLKFIMIGKGLEEKALKELEIKLGIEKFITHKYIPYEKMPQIYREANIYIAPSKTTKHWHEQFSTVLLEAKASGLPIISTNTGGIPENVGNAGFLVGEGEVEKMASLVTKLIKNPDLRIKMGNIAREDALKRFTIEKGARELDRVYEKVLR